MEGGIEAFGALYLRLIRLLARRGERAPGPSSPMSRMGIKQPRSEWAFYF